nr:immunoglobulin heavy chain junction region [Mus musculus]
CARYRWGLFDYW